jgi:hypothetical protein
MSKFLSKIEAYDPTLAENLDQRDEFRHLLKAAGLNSGNGLDGTLYIDDPENNRTFVVRLDGITQGAAGTAKPEEDNNEMDGALRTAANTNPVAAKAVQKKDEVIKRKLPAILKATNDEINKLEKFDPSKRI